MSNQCGISAYTTLVTMYSRAAASDYDDWKTKYGAEGWAFKDLLPYLKKVRTLLFVSVVLSRIIHVLVRELYSRNPDA